MGDGGERDDDAEKTFYFRQAKCMPIPGLLMSRAACSVCHETSQSGCAESDFFPQHGPFLVVKTHVLKSFPINNLGFL